MLYASLKAVHLLAVIVWVGGMFFMLMCLRPAVHEVLEAPARVRLMHATLRRFLRIVGLAVAVAVLRQRRGDDRHWPGAIARAAGLAFNMPLDWYAMVALFFVMLAVFLHVRLALFPRVERAVTAEAWPDGAARRSAAIRWEVAINLVLGIFIVVIGAARRRRPERSGPARRGRDRRRRARPRAATRRRCPAIGLEGDAGARQRGAQHADRPARARAGRRAAGRRPATAGRARSASVRS